MKIVRLNVYVTLVASPMTLKFTQGHSCLKLDNVLTFTLNSNTSDNISAMAFKLGITVELCIAYIYTLMLISMTLALVQGDSDLAEGEKISVELFGQLNKQ